VKSLTTHAIPHAVYLGCGSHTNCSHLYYMCFEPSSSSVCGKGLAHYTRLRRRAMRLWWNHAHTTTIDYVTYTYHFGHYSSNSEHRFMQSGIPITPPASRHYCRLLLKLDRSLLIVTARRTQFSNECWNHNPGTRLPDAAGTNDHFRLSYGHWRPVDS